MIPWPWNNSKNYLFLYDHRIAFQWSRRTGPGHGPGGKHHRLGQ